MAKGLQAEIAEAVVDRPHAVTAELFVGKVITDARGNEQTVDVKLAMPEFKVLWGKISPKSVYIVDFDTEELVKKGYLLFH